MSGRGAGLWLGLLLAAACTPGSAADDPQVRAQARRIWSERCANCHGPHGDGDGPQARHLPVSPRRLSDRAWKASVTDEHLRAVILEGGAAVGLDPNMAPNPDLRDEPAVLTALVEHVRRL